MLRDVGWQFVNDISGQHVRLEEGQNVQEDILILEDGTWESFRWF
jgi:hypothetical protein